MGHNAYPTLLYLSGDSRLFGPITYLTVMNFALVYLNLACEITHRNTRRIHDQIYYLHSKLYSLGLNLGVRDEKRTSKCESCGVVFLIMSVIFITK
jgi:hypothetical protein